MKIYLDFDGTVVDHEYPYIGEHNEGSFEVISKLQNAGHEIVLNTYRANCNDGTLEEALDYLNNSGKIQKITKVEPVKISPELWSDKIKDEIFIDDEAENIPIVEKLAFYRLVDWKKIDDFFIQKGIYNS